MAKVKVDNPNLLTMKDDTLYHFGLKKSTTNFREEFGDVKVCALYHYYYRNCESLIIAFSVCLHWR